MRTLRAAWRLVLNTLFPPVCVSCKKEGDFLCIDCIQSFRKTKIRSKGKKIPDPDFQSLDGVIYALDYAKNPQIKAAVKQFKYRFTQELADYFAELIVEKIRELNMVRNKEINLIPVPLHRKRLYYRGFNQAELIARAIENQLSDGVVKIVPLLDRVRETSQQARLNKKARHENLNKAFSVNKKFVQEYNPNHLYFLVDDVCTTGATLESCSQVLKANGLSKVYGLVVARQFRQQIIE